LPFPSFFIQGMVHRFLAGARKSSYHSPQMVNVPVISRPE
jgi:hypothetical protein